MRFSAHLRRIRKIRKIFDIPIVSAGVCRLERLILLGLRMVPRGGIIITHKMLI
jgi:hypothetical protein